MPGMNLYRYALADISLMFSFYKVKLHAKNDLIWKTEC